MTVLTISRQYGSGGDEIARKLCERLGYRLFDKRLVAEAAAEAGLSDQEIIDYAEENYKIRSFLDRLFNRSATLTQVNTWKEDAEGVRIPETTAISEDIAITLMKNAIKSAHKLGKVVIVGRGGQVLLRDKLDAIHVRIIADTGDRLYRVRERIRQEKPVFPADLSIRREAQDMILMRDAASKDYVQRFYQSDVEDPMLYHVVVNTSRTGIEGAVELITAMVLRLEQVIESKPVAV
jgi:CMP/dCMP kinase